MRWNKLGLIFTPDTNYSWSQSHAQVPTVDFVSNKIWRVYYCTRDAMNQSRISYFDVEAGNPSNVLYSHNSPILKLGVMGAFDDAGMMPSSIVTVAGAKYLYYTGWAVRRSVPYQNAIGLAISRDGGQTYERAGKGPVLGVSLHDPYFIGTATVIHENGHWRNWYATCTSWEIIDGNVEPRYHLKYAESQDGIEWRRDGKVAIDYKDANEGGLVRASVLMQNGRYLMWFSRRSASRYRTDRQNSYRIGYAESVDGINWKRMDEFAGIDLSDTGWDADMIAYPHVVQNETTSFMFYNGNGFGQSGIGVAMRQGEVK